MPVKVFISWSKPRSHEVAKAFADFLPRVIQECERPFVSSSIRKGDGWFGRIATELEAARVGIVFITAENQREEWLNFESGAMLTRVGEQQLCPVLIGLPSAEYTGPLKNLQLTTFEDKEEMRKLILDIHELSDSTVDRAVIIDAFDDRWERFMQAAANGMAEFSVEPVAESEERGTGDKLDEALELLRGLSRESRRSWSSETQSTNAVRAAWAQVRSFKSGHLSFETFAQSSPTLAAALYGVLVSLKDSEYGRIVDVVVLNDVVFAMVETGNGQGVDIPLVDLVDARLEGNTFLKGKKNSFPLS